MEQRQNNTCYSIQQTDAKTQKKHSNWIPACIHNFVMTFTFS
jgi:hypothetical protein